MPFDTLTATIAGAKPKQPSPIQVIVDIQRRIHRATESDSVTGPALAQLARAWSELEERKRVMRMRPAPKPIEVQPKSKAKHPRSSFTEGPEPGSSVSRPTTASVPAAPIGTTTPQDSK